MYTTNYQANDNNYGKWQAGYDKMIAKFDDPQYSIDTKDMDTVIRRCSNALAESQQQLAEAQTDDERKVAEVAVKDNTDRLNSLYAIKAYNDNRLDELKKTKVGETYEDGEYYSISHAQYKTNRGTVLDMHLVKFGKYLDPKDYKDARRYAEKHAGWYDRENGGFMMRDEDTATTLVERVLGRDARNNK